MNRVEPPPSPASIPNPLKVLGIARIVAGGWFIATGVTMVRLYRYLIPQAARLFTGDIGGTDAPIRSLLMLILAPLLAVIGVVLIVKGARWMRRVRLPAEGPASIDRDEVLAALRRHELLAFADAPTQPYWPLRRWLADELADLPWWRRDIISGGVRTLVRSFALALAISLLCLSLPYVTDSDWLGPFPAAFVMLLPFAAAVWAVLCLMLITPNGPRIESVELPLPVRAGYHAKRPPEPIIESPPGMLPREATGLGLTIGITGVAVQCLILSWWNLSPIGYPLLATSIIRHAASIAGGILFFLLGHRMVATAAELLRTFRYESMLVLVEDAEHGMIARAAEVRTESRGLTGPRHLVSMVGGTHVRESAARLITQ